METEKSEGEPQGRKMGRIKWKTTFLEQYLIVICLAIFVALLVTIGFAFHGKPGRIISHIDSSVDPCEDFYKFSCGTYLETPFSDSDESHISLNEESDELILRISKEILEKENDKEQLEFVKKVKQYYRSCLNTFVTQDAASLVQELLDKTNLKTWPIFEKDKASMISVETTLAIVNVCGRKRAILSITGLGNATAERLYLEPGTSFIRTEILLNTSDSKYIKQKEKYKKLLEYTFYLRKVPLNVAQPEIQEIMEFETRLANITNEKFKNNEDNYTEVKLKEFSSHCSGINWAFVVRSIYDYLGRAQDFNEEIIVRYSVSEYIESVCELLTETDDRIIYNYLVWFLLIQHSSAIDPFFQRNVEEIYRDIQGYVPPDRWITCANSMVFNELEPGLSYLVIKHVQLEKEIKEVKGYVHEVRKVLDQTFSEESWLSADSKDIAKRKLKDTPSAIGYSKESLDTKLLEKYFSQVNISDSFLENTVSISKWRARIDLFNDSFMIKDLMKVSWPIWTAGYFSGEHIAITLGYMMPPHFDLKMPKYFNYGVMGFIIAHEFMHGFDNIDDKTKSKYEWPEETLQQFKLKKRCYIDQYSRLTLGQNGTMINGTKTVRENICDNVGIILAFKAYENYLQQNGPELALPGMEFTNEQMFFIRFSQAWCEVDRSEENIYANIKHSPPRYRITTSLKNFPRFSEVFNCPLGSSMNPRKKCQMYG